MRFSQLIMMLMGILILSCDNDDYPHSEVPSVVLNEFWTHFPTATDVEIQNAGENFKVDFEINNNDAGAVIAAAGRLLKEKKEISFEQLPAEIQSALLEYGNDNIKDPEVVKTEKEIYYQAQVKGFWVNTKVVLDKTGKEKSAFSYWD